MFTAMRWTYDANFLLVTEMRVRIFGQIELLCGSNISFFVDRRAIAIVVDGRLLHIRDSPEDTARPNYRGGWKERKWSSQGITETSNGLGAVGCNLLGGSHWLAELRGRQADLQIA